MYIVVCVRVRLLHCMICVIYILFCPCPDFSSTSLTSGIGGPEGGSDVYARIQALSKKNRELTASLGGEQGRNRKLTAKIEELEKQV